MPYKIDWYIENEIIYHYIYGDMTGDELKQNLADLMQTVESSPRPLVHVIADQGDVSHGLSPKEMLAVLRSISLPDKLGWVILLRENSVLFKMSSAIATSLFKVRTRSFPDLEEAEAFLKAVDTTISWDNANQEIFIEK